MTQFKMEVMRPDPKDVLAKQGELLLVATLSKPGAQRVLYVAIAPGTTMYHEVKKLLDSMPHIGYTDNKLDRDDLPQFKL